jgi:peptidoglycan/LPS O-acetylase OafA/YrhL
MNVLAYFVFLQNFIIPLDLFFWESWSLAVEEWFYLLFPLSLAVTIGWWRRTPRYAFLAAVLLMLIIPAFLRFPAMDKVGTPFLLDLWVRKVVVLRLDTIGFGVLMAWVAFHAPAFFSGRRVEMFALGSIGLSTAILLRGGGDLMYMGTWFFTISGVSMALMIPLLANWQWTGKWGSIIEFLSRISYALYLVHMPVRHLYMELMIGRSAGASVLLYVGYWVLCLLISVLVHRYWERPWMALREPLSQRLLTMEVRSGRTPSPSS